MKKFFQYILMAAFIGGTVPLASCDDDEEVLNEWDMTYVSLLQADYLRPVPTTFNLTHAEGSGIEGTMEFSFMAYATEVVEQDVTVDFAVTTTLPVSEDKIALSAQSMVIKAGQKNSEPVTLSITDWSELEKVKDAAEYTLDINVKGMSCADDDVALSQFNQKFSFKIVKAAERPKQEQLVSTPTEWIFTFMDGVENANANSVAGTGSSDVATDGVPFWFTVDFKTVKTVSGIQTRHRGASYAPTKIELFRSDDGLDWVSLGQFDTSGSTQTVKLDERVDTRFLKYQMINVPGRVDIMSFSVYMYQ